MAFFTSRFWGSLIRASGLGRRRACRAESRSRWSVAALEQLETRIVPAGVANVTFAAGTLTITGVDDLWTCPRIACAGLRVGVMV